jgi:hypothetical protein
VVHLSLDVIRVALLTEHVSHVMLLLSSPVSEVNPSHTEVVCGVTKKSAVAAFIAQGDCEPVIRARKCTYSALQQLLKPSPTHHNTHSNTYTRASSGNMDGVQAANLW